MPLDTTDAKQTIWGEEKEKCRHGLQGGQESMVSSRNGSGGCGALYFSDVRTHERTKKSPVFDYQTGRHCLLFKD